MRYRCPLCKHDFTQTQSDSSVTIINEGDNYVDVTNSAEIEQGAKQLNDDCNVSVECVNTIEAQTQTIPVVTIFNSGDNYEDVENSAEVEQVAEQVNVDCNEFVICENNLTQTQSSVGGEDDSGGAGGLPGTATAIGAGPVTATPGAAGAGYWWRW